MVEPLFCNIDDKSIIYRFISDLFQVCTYFLIDKKKVIIVDPGKLNEDVNRWIQQYENFNKIIYITHEHFDHHFDVNYLLNFPRTSVYMPTVKFKNVIKNSRENLSYYYNVPIETNLSKITKKRYFDVIYTPGHSEFSYCFKYKNILFGGDTIIDGKYLVLKLPGANKSKFKESIEKLKNIAVTNTIVLPGHGDLFFFDKWFL